MIEIQSLQNQIVKDCANLHLKKYRQQQGLFLVEGLKIIEEALDSNWQIKEIFIEKNFLHKLAPEKLVQLTERSEKVYLVKEDILTKISDVQTAQGIVATVYSSTQQLEEEIFGSKAGLVLALETIQDPGNLGTLIRTAVATGVQAIILLDNCADIYSPKVVRGSMGAIFRIPIITLEREAMVSKLKKMGYRLVVTSLQNAQNVYEISLPEKMALVLGNEAQGISEFCLQASDLKIVLPQIGKIESLNVAIAGSVLMYEYLRQNK